MQYNNRNMAKLHRLTESAKKKMAEPTAPVKGLELGDTGTRIYKGFIREEYNAKLQGREGIEVYEEMRKSDGTVHAIVSACTLPIRRAKWMIEPGGEEQSDLDIADFVSFALFEAQSIKWDDIVRQALLSLPFGVMVFEKVFKVGTFNGKEYMLWDKFAPRLPRSIQAWEMQNGQPGIQQLLNQGGIANIPWEKLIVIVNELEGSNWWGNSILRAAYKHWYMKKTLYAIDAIAAERQGLGVPKVKMPEGATEEDRSKAETILKNLRANEHAYIIEPFDYEIMFMDMMSSTTRDLSPAIAHHNREISKSVLAQFLELGSTASGSRALSTDQTDLFLESEEAIANGLVDAFNVAIKQLVDLNFNDVERYPELSYAGINKIDAVALSTTYQTFITAGAIKAGQNDEPYLRELMGLPERDQSDDPTPEEQAAIDAKAKADKAAQDKQDPNAAIDKAGMSDHKAGMKKKIYPERDAIRGSVRAATAPLPPARAIEVLKAAIAGSEEIRHGHVESEWKPIAGLMKSVFSVELADLRRKNFADDNPFKSWRALTFAEKKVNFDALQTKMDQLEEAFNQETQDLLHDARDTFISKLTKALNSDDKEAVKDATIEVKNAYAKIIKDAIKEGFQYGKTNAAREMGVTAPATAREVLSQIDIQADAIANLHIEQIATDAKNAMVDALSKGSSNAVALAAADDAASAAIDELTTNTSQIIMAGSINNGRSAAFDANSENIYALQRSEILDSATCNYCLSIDGRVVEKDDPFAENTIFHSNCRGIWVEILLAEEELPPIGGIPQSLRDRFGDAVNDLIQPRQPQTTKNSLARKEVERRQKRKAANQ